MAKNNFEDWPDAKLKKYLPQVEQMRDHFVANQDFDRGMAMRQRMDAMRREQRVRRELRKANGGESV